MHTWIHEIVVASWPAATTHILQSTVLALVLYAISFFPRFSARTRHAILLLALAKFFVPFASIAKLLAIAGVDLSRVMTLPNAAGGAGWVLLGMSGEPGQVVHSISEWRCGVAIAWLLGASILFARWLVGLSRAKSLVAGAAAADQREAAMLAQIAEGSLAKRVRAVRSELIASPCVAGVLRPVIVLPTAAETLTDEELSMLLEHELAHVRRLDNFFLNCQALAVAILWMNPVAWLLSLRLRLVSEAACDERVLETGANTGDYVAAMMKMCRLPSPRTFALPAMAESHLGERIRSMSKFETRIKSQAFHAVVVAALLLLIVATAAFVAPRADGAPTVAPSAPKLPLLSTGKADTPHRTISAKVEKLAEDQLQISIDVRDRHSGKSLSAPRVITRPNETATTVSGTQTSEGKTEETRLEIVADANGKGEVWYRSLIDDAVVDEIRVPLVPVSAAR